MLLRCLSTFLCLLVIGLLAAPAVSAAPSDAKAAKDAEAAPGDFESLYRPFKELVARMFQIKEQYQNDPNANRKALEEEYKKTVEKAQTLTGPLGAAAERSYQAAPNQNKELVDFLYQSLIGAVSSDSYEDAARMAKLLTDNKAEIPKLDLLAGLAFFGNNDFDDAEKYLKLAKEKNQIDERGSQYLSVIDKYKDMWAKEEKIRAAEAKAKNLPRVKLETTKGDIVLELFENEAPIATANFISLVEKKFYDGLTFHRVLPGFMAQGGDPKGDGTGGPGYTIPCECYNENHRNHFGLSLSMAKGRERDSGGSQFFITFLPTPHLDGQHTVFGRVVEGSKVVPNLERHQPNDPGKPDKILHATVLSKRNHKYEPVKRLDKQGAMGHDRGGKEMARVVVP